MAYPPKTKQWMQFALLEAHGSLRQSKARPAYLMATPQLLPGWSKQISNVGFNSFILPINYGALHVLKKATGGQADATIDWLREAIDRKIAYEDVSDRYIAAQGLPVCWAKCVKKKRGFLEHIKNHDFRPTSAKMIWFLLFNQIRL